MNDMTASEHLDKYIDVMDLRSLEILKGISEKHLSVHYRICDTIPDINIRKEFDDLMADKVAYHTEIIQRCNTQIEKINLVVS